MNQEGDDENNDVTMCVCVCGCARAQTTDIKSEIYQAYL
jgi:hypothetical protein